MPMLVTVDRTLGGFRVSGTLDVPVSASATPYRISVYASTQCDVDGFGEGERLLGSSVVNLTQTSGEAFSIDIDTPLNLDSNSFISTVATGPSGSSEFSHCLQIDAPLFANSFE
jgi:hypothetical protein